ncbi:SDR family NAD(P)-dependent oxidoreductase [Spirosoma sp. HMF4905]|uniref:SDR family NAD(P)-dependent oxidoreductase n=1 Tax=Spirosoma arboris TaxID=2682092 RepID=A0A7K1SBY3_9BACT|nr:SDR family oxidoreductase [Spirosoma arboris]MVM31281.1 SDR family NAD(P)-dependent oxidoreductase [Spirosoma arboris]
MNTGTGKTALITGASSGIGQELAKLFAQDGYNLVLVARSDDKLDRLADVFKSNYGTQEITVIGKDLATEDAAQDVYNQVKAKGITVDALVNDAGVGLYGLFATDTDWEREKAMIHLNVLTLTQMTKLFLYDMLSRNEGKILNLASLLSITPTPLMAVYAGTKAYVYNFTQSLINEVKDTNVSITALLPNATDTDFFYKAGAENAKVTDEVQDPVIVAKAGYVALMAGKSKAVPGGFKNKSYEVLSYVAPQETLAAVMRDKMSQKPEPEEKEPTISLAWGIGFGIAVIAGIALTIGYKNSSDFQKAKYRYKAKSAGNTLSDTLSSVLDTVVETVVDAYQNTKAKAEKIVAQPEEIEEEVAA